jgi:hypothetical protein
MIKFTTANYERSHGKAPRGRGNWGFQRTNGVFAYDRDLHGQIFWFSGTYQEAKRKAVRSNLYHPDELLAVLP